MLLPLLVAALAATPARRDSVPAHMGRGVSRELATERAARIRNVRYDLRLDVTGRDTAAGHVTVRFVRVGVGDVILDFRGLALTGARANGAPVTVEANGAHIRVPASALRTGANTLDFDFAAAMAPAGASIIRFRDATDGADYLYTLLVPADANALFPCFDQPDLKARVTLALTAPRAWVAVANGALAGADTLGTTVTHRFAETEPISTYLIAFAAGPWTRVTGPAAAGGALRRPMTMYVRRSRAAEAESDSLLATNARAVRWLEGYFARPYPFGKFDFVLAPAFPFGGMEHPGAVFYNEETFIFRERPTLTQRLGRDATIFHEVAHQWFGDLVTMRWFDDLWLKEGFATYMAAKMQDALSPGANAWKTFYLRNKPAAYAVDASDGTTPVSQPLANLDQAKSNYGAIVYNKAPSVLKQLNFLVGDAAFQAGVRAFLRTHAYGNATWRDLLGAIGAASGRSLAAWGTQYILRPGLPVIEQRVRVRALAGGDSALDLSLAQRPARPLSGGRPWPVRLGVVSGVDTASATWTHASAELRSALTPVFSVRGRKLPRWVFANDRDHAYGLVLLDPRSAAWVERNVGSVSDGLLRAMLWGAMWDLVREGRLAPGRYIELAMRELPREGDEQIVSGVLARVSRATEAYLADEAHAAVIGPLEHGLAAAADDSARAYGIRKAHLDALISVATSPGALVALDARLDSATAAGAPLRPPTRWAIVTALIERGAPGADTRLAAETRRDSTTEGKRRAFVARAARASAATKAEYFRRYFADSTLNEDWATASLRAFNSPRQNALTFRYLVPALDSLSWIQTNRRIFFLGNWLGAFLDGQRSPDALAAVDRYLADHPALPADLRQKILQSADELRRTVRIRRDAAQGMR
ncbi:MAG: M1 family aminopeptidase [Gemmatimonadaceae bacterium]